MIYKYGIDFGTTNSSIALRFVGDDQEEHTQVIDVKNTYPKETLPSVVLINANGKISVGEEALNQYAQSRAADRKNQQLIKKIKLDLEEQGSSLSYLVGNVRFDAADLIAAILKALRVKADREAEVQEVRISGVVMGVPVQYGDIQKNILKESLVKAGFYETIEEADAKTEFVSEPIAVAVHYGLNLQSDKNVLVFDFGGGTLDLAIVNLKKQVNTARLHPHKTIAKDRLTLGGEELTRLFFIHSFCSSSKYGVKYLAKKFGFSPDSSPEELWADLSACAEGARFIKAIEICKCDLSRAKRHKFSFIGRNIQIDEMSFYPDDFTSAIQDELDRIDDLLDHCLELGNITDVYDIDHVILAGGSSLIPAVQELLFDRFGTNRVSIGVNERNAQNQKRKRSRAPDSEVLTSIVRGLAMIGCRAEELVEDTVDNDYGVWDSIKDCFLPIIKMGTPVKDTDFDRLTQRGYCEEVECRDKDASSVKVLVYQRNLNGEQQLGTISIQNPGSKKYKVYMQIDRKKGMLVVSIYDKLYERWIDEIPLDERQYTLI